MFATAYAASSFLDLFTTRVGLALNHAAREGNIAATSGGAYDQSRALLITLAGGAILVLMFWSGLKGAPRVPQHWLERPRTAVNQASLTMIVGWDWNSRRRPLTFVSFAMALVLLRLAAATNNAMVAFGQGWMSWMVGRAAHFMPQLAATALVVVGIYWLLALAVAPLAARLVNEVGGGSGQPARAS